MGEIAYTINGATFKSGHLPEEAVPVEVTQLQAAAALLQAGKLEDVEAWFDGPQVSTLERLAWQRAGTWERQSLLLMSVAIALGWTDAEVDELFRLAASIRI